MLRQVSLALLALIVGGGLTVGGFVAYFADYATLNLIGFFYGIPLLLGGLAFRVTELKPVPVIPPTSPDMIALRKQQATKTQKQIFADITRYRYGQQAHLDSALNYLGLRPTDEERPVVTSVRESAVNGNYALTLVFNSPLISYQTWQQKQDKMVVFFGPGVSVDLANPIENQVEVSIITAPAKVEGEAV
jgi:Protein of unknown function (DUF2854)